MNLIVTCARHFEPETEEELADILKELGDAVPKVSITNMSGILTATTELDPIVVVKRIKDMVLDQPWSVRYCMRVIPIQKVIETEIEVIEKSAADLFDQILDGETYRIVVEKRSTNLSSQEIITKIAGRIKNKVSLELPDKILLVEILGNRTGISVLKKEDMVSVEKIKRSMSD